jgi:hypothetical protein
MSCVPSYVFTASKFITWRMTWYLEKRVRMKMNVLKGVKRLDFFDAATPERGCGAAQGHLIKLTRQRFHFHQAYRGLYAQFQEIFRTSCA